MALLTSGTCTNEIEPYLTEALTKSDSWFKDHKLSLTTPKPKCIVLGTAQRVNNLNDITIPFRDAMFTSVHTFWYLGVMIDWNLKFDAHVNYLRRKAYTKLKALVRARQFIDQMLAIQMYKSLIIHLDHADVI